MIVDGWLDWTVRVDGHPGKVYTAKNSGSGIACHSIEGNLPNHSIPSRFLSDDRNPDGSFTGMAAASVMFILYRDGQLTQMYDVSKSTWTSGGPEGNCNFWAVEAEGVQGVPLTEAQEDTFIRLVTEWEAYTGHTAAPNMNILQHKQIAAEFGYAPTACASDRYDNAWARISAGERYGEMTPEERAKLDAVYAALTGGVDSVIEDWNKNGNSLLLGYALEQGKLADHLSGHTTSGKVPKGTTFTGVIQ